MTIVGGSKSERRSSWRWIWQENLRAEHKYDQICKRETEIESPDWNSEKKVDIEILENNEFERDISLRMFSVIK